MKNIASKTEEYSVSYFLAESIIPIPKKLKGFYKNKSYICFRFVYILILMTKKFINVVHEHVCLFLFSFVLPKARKKVPNKLLTKTAL